MLKPFFNETDTYLRLHQAWTCKVFSKHNIQAPICKHIEDNYMAKQLMKLAKPRPQSAQNYRSHCCNNY